MEWFKLYSEARKDSKLESLSDAHHRVWFKLMCLANDQEKRGTIPPTKDKILALEVARGDVSLMREAIAELVDLEILTEDEQGLTFLNFKKRQDRKPSDEPDAAAQRQREKRARDKANQEHVSRPCHAHVTPESHDDHAIKSKSKERDQDPEVGHGAGGREESTTTDQAPSENPQGVVGVDKRDGLTGEERALLGEAQKGMIFPPEDFPLRVAKQIAALVGGREQTDPAVHAAWMAMPIGQQARWCHAAMALTREKGIEQRFWLNYATKAIVRSLETGSDLVAERKKITAISEAPSAKKEPARFADKPWGDAWERFASGNDRDRVMKLAGRPAAVTGVKGCNVLQALAIFDREGVEAAMTYVWPFWLQEAKQANG